MLLVVLAWYLYPTAARLVRNLRSYLRLEADLDLCGLVKKSDTNETKNFG